MKAPTSDIRKAYKTIKSQKSKFGIYQKVCFHVHTPESYDYKLLDDWTDSNYKKATEQDIFNICIKNKVFLDSVNLTDISLDGELEIFENKKEFLSFMLLANSLLDNFIEMVVVADHNTISGVKKLRQAIKELKKYKAGKTYPEVITGIEISCADKTHIVGVFDDGKNNKLKELNSWLNDSLMSVEEGTYKSGLDALNYIYSIGGIGYIAHINSSNILKSDYLSGAYKYELLSKQKNFGVSNLDKIDDVRKSILGYLKKDSKIVPQFIVDNDSHYIEGIKENCFWIKGSKKNFSVIKEALNDYDISVSLKPNTTPQSYIEGLYFEYTENGFLCGKENKPFCIKFSPALNCLIGGRGTGKSSILEILEYTLSQRCSSKEKLDFICEHDNIWVLYHYNNDEYLIGLHTPIKNNDDIMKYFGQNPLNIYGYEYYFREEEVRELTLKKYIYVYKIIPCNESWKIDIISNKKEILRMLFDTRYSINELVNTAGSKNINKFIYDTMFNNKTLSNPSRIISAKRKSGLKRMLDDTTSTLEKRKKEVNDVITPFNNNQKNVLRITYSQQGDYEHPPIFDWLFKYEKPNKWYENKNITLENVYEYLLALYFRLGLWNFLSMIINVDVTTANKYENLLSYCSDITPKMIDKGISAIENNEVNGIIEEIFKNTITNDNISEVIGYIKNYVIHTERFVLEFNINNKAGTNHKAEFKPVNELSLGQKVVAMLSFVLGYSEYSGDYRPLIIDQPEDNLDNQYIYKNLVKQLREIKEKRQVIIATHNATIVTNAKSDQVCVMESANNHGWVEATGYPGETKIKKHIINYLEGGRESFLHKINIYDDVLK